MKLILILFAFSILPFFSCNSDDEVAEKTFNATVIKRGMDCGNSFLIQFNKNASGLPDNNFDNVFYEINLPDEFKVEGKSIKVEIRNPNDNEAMFCTTQGLGYRQIFIKTAK